MLPHATVLTLLTLLPLAVSDDAFLSALARNASPLDIRGQYLLLQSTGTFQCPLNITHTTWRRISDGTIGLPHNTIVQDDSRCESTADERSLRFYPATDYTPDLEPVGDAPPLPEDFVRVMEASGFNKNARRGLRAAGDRYLMGYERSIRVCGGMGKFGIGTTAFLLRPTQGVVVIQGLSPLQPGLKYLLMVPRFRASFCLYSSDVNGPDDAFRPLPSVEPSVTDEFELDTTEPSPPVEVPTLTTDPQPSGEVLVEASGSPEEPLAAEDDGVCFPAEATVELRDGRRKRMDEVRVGDSVHVGGGKYSVVFGFSHNDADVEHVFVSLHTREGSISATEGHYIYVNSRVARIESARRGDFLTLGSGEQAVVTAVSRAVKRGLYNPQTLHGDIVVDGVVATTYTKTVDPRLAHAALAPVRALFRACRVDGLTAMVPDLRALWVGRTV